MDVLNWLFSFLCNKAKQVDIYSSILYYQSACPFPILSVAQVIVNTPIASRDS